MTKFYIEVVGPYDGSMIGPFSDREQARIFIAVGALDPNVYDTYIIDQAALDKRIAEFGPIEVEPA